MNRATLVGRVGADPEIRRLNNGSVVANIRLATSERWKDKNTGERKEKTEWHTVVVWNEGLAGIVERFVKKGDQILVEGKIATRKWQDQSGNDRYSTEIVLDGFGGTIELLGGKREGDGNTEPRQQQSSAQSQRDIDDEIPF